ncbi:MAG: bifunctional nicotinamidase/pyrazinamidase [Cyclobacteriaceae bacterium]
MKVLIIVDIQHDFLPEGALEVPNGNEIIPITNQLQDNFELVVATQDWHPRNHRSFASNHEGKKPFDQIKLHGMDQILWPDHCLQGSNGAELAEQLNKNKIEAIFRKGTNPEIDSYSGFYDNGHQKSTGLADYLRGRNVNDVFLAGLAGDICVYFTAMDAIKEGFTTYLIEDATRPLKQEDFEKAKNEITKQGGKVVQSTAVLTPLN